MLEQFKAFLFSQEVKPSKVTVKNYLSDINHFIRWYESHFNQTFDPKSVTHQTIEQYKQQSLGINDEGLMINDRQSSIVNLQSAISERSFERHLSSLRKFFTFLKLEGKISYSPFEQLKSEAMSEADPWHIKDFKNNLYVFNASHLTIKNYLIDIKQFLNWTKEVLSLNDSYDLSANNLFEHISGNLLEEYKQRLVSLGTFTPATINRKLSSLRKYTSWLEAEGLIGNQELKIMNYELEKEAELQQSPKPQPSAISHQPLPASYSSFPPFRLLQKVTKGINLAIDATLITQLVKIIEKAEILLWKTKGMPVFVRRFTPIKNLRISADFNPRKSVSNIKKELYAPLEISTKFFPWYKKAWFSLRYKRPNWYKTYHSYAIVHYFHFAVLVIFAAGLVFGFYTAFVGQQKTPTLAANVPTNPKRILNFQGRLTDASDNPITSATNLRFSIYTQMQPGTGSAILLWQEVDQVTPDTDGIFNSILGNTATVCANPLTPATGQCSIPSSLFSENNALFLGVTVETTPELTPRQQLATVAFASNSETLQGLLPITATAAGTTNVVLALDSTGNLTIGGSATPTFQASGGQFKLSGQTLVLTTNAASNGNIQLAPDGTGRIDLTKPLVNTSLSNNISTAVGSVEVDDLFSILATSSGQSALTINQTGAGPLISASASGVAKFTVDNSGNITAAGVYKGSDGGISAPTYSFTNFTNTGMYTNLNGSVILAQNGVDEAIFDAAGLILVDGQIRAGDGNEFFKFTNAGSAVNELTLSNAAAGGIVTLAATGGDTDVEFSIDSKGTDALNLNNNATGDVNIAGGSGTTGCTVANATGNLTCSGTITGTGATGYWTRLAGNLSPATTNDTISATTSAAVALTLTQTGAFNALLVQDEASDTTPFVIDQSGNVGIGTTAPGTYKLNVQGTVNFGTTSVTNGDLSVANTITVNNGTSGTSNLLVTSGSVLGHASINLSNTGASGNNWQLFVGGNNVSGQGGASPEEGNFQIKNVTDGLTRLFIAKSTGNVGIGTTSPLSTLDVRGNSGTTPVASVSGTTSFAGLVVDNSGVGDLFTASSSGTNKFAVKQNGTLIAPQYATCTLKTDVNGLFTCGSDNGGTNWWNQLAGALSPVNVNDDFLIGGTATTSAKFSYTGIQSGHTIASASGNLIVMANNGWGGNVGIGTTAPTGKLDVTDTSNSAASFSLTNNTATTIGNGVNTLGVIDLQSTSLTTGKLVNIEANALTSGKAVNVTLSGARSTAITGKGIDIYFAPTYNGGGAIADSTTALRVNYGYGADGGGAIQNSTAVTRSGNLAEIIDAGFDTQSGSYTNSATALYVYSSALNSGFGQRIVMGGYGGQVGTALSISSIGDDGGSSNTSPVISVTSNTSGSALSATVNSMTTGSIFSGTANTLTSGTGLSLASSSNAFTGSLIDVTLSGSNVANTGSLLQLTNSGTANANTSLYIKHYATGTNNLAFRVDDVSGDTTPFVIDGDGNVGIGTTAPGYKLDVSGQVNSSLASTGANGQFSANNSSVSGTNGAASAFQAYALPGYTTWIGTTADGTDASYQSNYGSAVVKNQQGIVITNATNGLLIHSINNNIRFATGNAGTEKMRLSAAGGLSLGNSYVGTDAGAGNMIISGNVGIGTTAPTAKLDVNGDASLSANLSLRGAATAHTFNILQNGTLDFQTSPGGDAGLASVVYISNNGNVGLGTSTFNGSTSNQLRVVGNAEFGNATGIGAAPVAGQYLTLGSTANNLVIPAGTTSSINLTSTAGTAVGGILFGTDTTLYRSAANTLKTDDSFTAAGSAITFSTFTTNGGLLYTNGSGLLTQLTSQGSLNDCLLSGGSGAAASFGSCASAAASSIYWTQANGALYPKNSTVDLLVGGTSTAAAQFSVTGINNNKAVASVSGQLIVMPNNGWGGNVGIGTTSPGAALTLGSISGISAGGILFGTDTTLYRSSALVLKTDNNFWAVNRIGVGIAPTSTIGLYVDGAGSSSTYTASFMSGNVGIGTTSPTTSLFVDGPTLGAAATFTDGVNATIEVGVSALFDPYIKGTVSSNLVLGANNSEVMRLTTTGNVGIGTASPISELHVTRPLSFGATGKALAIFDQIENQDIFTASKSGVAKFVIDQNGQVGIGTTLPGMLLDVVKSSAGLNVESRVWNSDNTNGASNARVIAQTGGSSGGDPIFLLNTGANIWTMAIDNSDSDKFKIGSDQTPGTNTALTIQADGNVGIGTTSPTALLHVNGGYSNNAALIVNNLNSGDLFTASASGVTKFTVGNSGTITSAAYTTGGGIIYATSNGLFSQTTAGASNECLKSQGGSTPTWGTCGSGGDSFWGQANGLLYPGNSTVDLAIGGTASTSAKFLFANVNSGTPTLKIFDSTKTFSLNLSHDGTNANILSTTGTVNIGQGGGTLYVQTDIQNDSTNNLGAIQITDRLNVLPAATSNINSNAAFIVNNPGTGDILTASAGGTQKFTITNAGGIRLGTSEGSANNCLLSGGTGIAASWSTCGGVNWWNQLAGALSPVNINNDFAIGGTATSSAKFSYTGIQSGQTIASVSGQLIVMANNGWGGNVGIGTTAPTQKLDITGNVNASGNYYLGSTSFYLNSTNLSVASFNLTSNAGIYISPGATSGLYLNWSGATNATGVFFGNGNSTVVGKVNSSGYATFGSASDLASTTYALYANGKPSYFDGDGTNAAFFQNGNVGIGTTAPDTKLTVNFDSGTSLTGTTAYGGFHFQPSGTDNDFVGITAGANNAGVTRIEESEAGILFQSGSTYGTRIHFLTTDNFGTGMSQRMIINESGNVGIGTTSPTALLDVAGTASVGGVLKFRSGTAQIQSTVNQALTIGGDTTGNITLSPGNSITGSNITPGITNQVDLGTAALQWRNVYAQNFIGGTTGIQGLWQRTLGSLAPTNITDSLNLGAVATGSALVHLAGTAGENSWINTGNVGIGTTGPSTKLDVQNTAFTGTTPLTNNVLRLASNANGAATTINLTDATTYNAYIGMQAGNIHFGANTTTPQVTLLTSGNVGIGTTSPTALLHVNGGYSNNAALIVNNLNSGDLFTASASGVTKFKIGNTGAITDAFYATCTLKTDANGLFTCGTDNNTGVNWWNQLAGALSPVDTTNDFLLGSTATSTAEFAFTGLQLANHQTQASFSGQFVLMPNNGYGGNASISGALTLGAFSNGVIQTTRNQGLTIGGNTTGNIALMPRNGSGFVGIGTTNPSFTTDISSGDAIGLRVITTNGSYSGIQIGNSSVANRWDLLQYGSSTGIPGDFSIEEDGQTARLVVQDGTGNVGIGGEITGNIPVVLLDVKGNSGILGVASISAKTSFATLVVDNSGVGDLFTASSSGLPLFTVKKAGTLVLGAPIYQTGACTLKTDTTGLVTCGTDNTGSGVNWWNQANGTLYPFNSTVDLLIGGQATTSAIFALINVNSGTPTLNIWNSVSHTNALSLSATATDASITATTGIINIGQGGGTLYVQTDIQNDSATTPTGANGAIKINDKLLVSHAENGIALAVFDNTGTGDILTASTSGTTRFKIANDGTVLPGADNTYNLGSSPSGRWKNLFLGGGSLHIQCKTSDAGCPTSQGIDYGFQIDSGGTLGIGANISTLNPADLNITQGGNVGIGTTAPTALLHVNGGYSNNAALIVNNVNSGDIIAASASGATKFRVLNAGTIQAPSFYDIDSTTYFLDPAATGISLNTAGDIRNGTLTLRSDALEEYKTNGNSAVVINYYGYNGGATQYRDLAVYNGQAGATPILFVDGSAGNVGIGTTTPSRLLTLTTAFATRNTVLSLVNTNNNAGAGTGLFIAMNNSAAAEINYGGLSATIVDNTAGSEDGNVQLREVINGTLTDVVNLQGGNVGIGVTGPSARLHAIYAAANSGATTPVAILDNPAGGTQTDLQFRINNSRIGDLRTDSSGNIVLSGTGAGGTYLAWDGGTGGVIFGNGASVSNANVSAAGAYTGTSLNVGSGAITSGLINGQTISSAANFTGSVTIATTLAVGGATSDGVSITNSASPTITFKDTDNRTGYWHMNSDIMYLLSGANGAGIGGWAQVGGQWPLMINTSTNLVTVGGDLAINGGNITTALTLDSTLTATGAITANGGITCTTCIALASEVSGTLPVANGGTGVTTSTGTGNVVLSASPTFSGTITADVVNLSGRLTISGADSAGGFLDVENTNTADTTGNRVLMLRTGTAASGGNTRFVKFFAAGTAVGNINLSPSAVTYDTAGADFAEYFKVEEAVEYGDIISTTANGNKKAIKGETLIGAVSYSPGFVGNNKFQDDPIPVNQALIGIIGHVPTKVSTINGPIKVGDYITSSDIPGVGMKATTAGQVVGKAMEEYTNPDSNAIGKISVLVNVNWYDPDIYLTSTGDLNLVDQTATADANFTVPHYFSLNDALGNPIDRVGAFAELAVAKLRVGLVNAQQITTQSLSVATENVTIGGQSLRNYIATIVTQMVNGQWSMVNGGNIISPIASIDEVHTNLISPLANDSKIALKLENDKLSIVNGNSASASAVSSFDNQGNATFSGQISANQLSIRGNLDAGDASISGTLRAGKILASDIVGLNIQAATISANYITNNYYASSSATSNQQLASSFPTLTASSSSTNSSLLAASGYISVAPFASEFAYVENLSAATASFSQGLMVFGPTTLSDTSVVGQLSVNGSLILADNSINVLGSDLNLQPLRQGGLSIMAGLFYIDTNGNATFEKDTTVKGTLYANAISSLPGQDLTLKLASSSGIPNTKYKIQDTNGSDILSVNQLGDLVASGAATFSKLNLGLVSPALAVSPTEVIATGSAGTGSINTNKTQMTINNKLVTDKSLIYITPTTNTNQTLFLLRQVPGESFTVGIQNPSITPIQFNWIIVN